MTMQHTLGPWNLAQYSKGTMPPIAYEDHKTIAVMADGKTAHGDVAYMHHALWGDDEALANARLIAAAPDLKDALQMLYDEIADYIKLNNLGGMDNQSMKFARAALDKACWSKSK